MTSEELSRELCQCGPSIFVEFFEPLDSIDWTTNQTINAGKKMLLQNIESKRRPNGQPYSIIGFGCRFNALQQIWTNQQEAAALQIIAASRALPTDVRKKAIDLLIKHFDHRDR